MTSHATAVGNAPSAKQQGAWTTTGLNEHQKQTSAACEHQTKATHSVHCEEVKGYGAGVSGREWLLPPPHMTTCYHVIPFLYLGLR